MTRELEEIRRLVHESIDGRDVRTRFERTFVFSMSTMIVLNVIALMLETLPDVQQDAEVLRAFDYFEYFSVTVFAMEYLTRVWSCTADPRFRHPIWGRLRFMLKPLSVLDLLAIASVLPGFFELRYLRLFRLARFLRLFKLGRYSESWKVFGRVFRAKRSDLVLSVAASALLVVVCAFVFYYAEKDVQQERFSSIPAAIWVVMNVTTVGYEGLKPETPVGKGLAVLIALVSIAVFAIPAGIFASGFSEEMNRRRGLLRKCPHCGKSISGD